MRSRFLRFSTFLAILALVLAACGGTGASPQAGASDGGGDGIGGGGGAGVAKVGGGEGGGDGGGGSAGRAAIAGRSAGARAGSNENASISEEDIHGTCWLLDARDTPTRVRLNTSSIEELMFSVAS